MMRFGISLFIIFVLFILYLMILYNFTSRAAHIVKSLISNFKKKFIGGDYNVK